MEESFRVDDAATAQELVRRHGFATIVAADLTATHMPALAEDGFTIVSHVARADPFSAHVRDGARLLMIFHGPQGYVSASWYPTDALIPTWDHVTLHVRGRVEVVPARPVLEATVDHFERPVDEPWRLEGMEDMVEAVVGFRLHPEDWHLEAKLHQDKPADIRQATVDGLTAPGPYQDVRLAALVSGGLSSWMPADATPPPGRR